MASLRDGIGSERTAVTTAPTTEDRPLTDAAPVPLVTFLFSDVQGSTRLWEDHPEPMREALARHDALLIAAIAEAGGHVFKTGGDAFFAAFDRPEPALRAALAIQRALQGEPWGLPGGQPLRVRLALHTGAAELRGGDYFGGALSRAARLLGAAHGGQTLVSEATAALVGAMPDGLSLRRLGRHRLKDLAEPQELFGLEHPDLPADFPPPRSLEAFQHNLPAQLTSFVGRETEMGEARTLLRRERLVTLTGTGGSGKSRLAVQVAAESLDKYPDGAWLVELAPLTDPQLVTQAVASVLGLGEEPDRRLMQTLTDALRPKALLLVLDNCEHLIDACARLADGLLRACPALKILATSRESLGVPGEAVLPVSSLSFSPADPARTAQSLAGSGAVRLFVDRATTAQPGFRLDDANAPAVARICADLDGIPLALELAAARVKVLSPQQIASRLDDRFRLLSGGSRTALPRQQTLRALIDWSYDLLPSAEQALFRRLSVFHGGWALEAAEAVCSGGDVEELEILELLSRLVAKSLVVVEPPADGQVRYRLLENLRRYGRERLAETDEGGALAGRHRDWYLALAEEAAPLLTGPDQAAWLDRLARDHDNLRAALAAAGGAEAVRLAGALWRFWHVRGYPTEGRQWSEAALARGEDAAPDVRAQALGGAGILAWAQQDYPAAQRLCEASLGLWQSLGNRGKAAGALNTLAMVAEYQGDYATARAHYEQVLTIFEQLGDAYRTAVILGNLGALSLNEGDPEKAAPLFEQSLALHQSLGNELGIASTFHNMGEVAQRRGRHDDAVSLYGRSLTADLRLGDVASALRTLVSLVAVDVSRCDFLRAACLLGAIEGITPGGGQSLMTILRGEYADSLARVRAELSPSEFTAAWDRGLDLSLEEVVRYAVSPSS